MKILLSIKPQYAKKIFSGEKKYEYRRALFKNKEVSTVIVYATKPVGKVIGEFEIDSILSGSPHYIWEKTKEHGGIKKSDYFQYFKEKEIGFAIKIKSTLLYQVPKELMEISSEIKQPPQSFIYIIDEHGERDKQKHSVEHNILTSVALAY